MTSLARSLPLVLVLGLVVAAPAIAWDSRDEAAAEHYRELERERAKRYRARVERGDVAAGTAQTRVSPRPERPARREAARRRPARRGAWDREVEAWQERARRWSEELGGELAGAIRDAIDDALEPGGSR